VEVQVKDELKHLMKELGEAINGSLADSESIAESIAKIKAQGYDVFLVLDATIGFNKHGDTGRAEAPAIVGANRPAEFRIDAQDVKFLKSLRIAADDTADAA
jgi:hypothetical protein